MNRIADLRKQKKISQQKLADAIGTTRQAISNYEIGAREPKMDTWEKMSKILEASIPYLQGTSDIKNPSKYYAKMKASIQKKNSQSLEELYGEEFNHIKDEQLRSTIFQALDIFRAELLGLSRVEQTAKIKDTKLKSVVESLNTTQIESIRKILKLTANSREVVTLATAGKFNTTNANNQLKQLREGLAMLQRFNTLLDNTNKHLKQLH